MKKFFAEFKAFALKGNVMSLAVGVIIGGAFQGVVSSLTDNIISPIIGLFMPENTEFLNAEFFGIRYGAFISAVIDFFIMALIVFMLVRLMNKLMPEKPPAPAAPAPKCPFCLSEINEGATRCPACTSQLDQ